MVLVSKAQCIDCGLELADDGRVFTWNSKTGLTEDFLILMRTHHRLDEAEITGDVHVTYCSKCGKYLRVYEIQKASPDITNPVKTVCEGIKNHIMQCTAKINHLKEIRNNPDYKLKEEDYCMLEHTNTLNPEWIQNTPEKILLEEFLSEIDSSIRYLEKSYEKYANSMYLVGEQFPDKVECPGCGDTILKKPVFPLTCPRCGGIMCFSGPMCLD